MAPSEKHNKLACMGLTWLKNKVSLKGMRGNTEVTIDKGYVADAIALCSLQNRFFADYCKDSDMEPMIAHAVIRDGKRQYELSGQVDNYFACLFEAKATRADFLRTFGSSDNHRNRHIPIASLHWCVTPRKLIKADELPDFWGLLEEYGPGLTEIRKARINIFEEGWLDKIAHQMLWTIQARRNTIICEGCGRWLHKAYCNRCSIKRFETGQKNVEC